MALDQVYLHIGMNKTGTTTIQSWLCSSAGKSICRGAGVHYPMTGRLNNAHYDLSAAFGFSHGKTKVDKTRLARLGRKLSFEMLFRRANSVLFSSEMFCIHQPMQALKEWLAPYQVKVIVYLRRHDHWFESAYNQALKTTNKFKYPPSIQHFISFQQSHCKQFINYQLLLQKWAKAFGKQNVIVKPFEEELFRQIGLREFAATFGGKMTTTPDNVLNSSMLPEQVLLLEKAIEMGMSLEQRQALLRNSNGIFKGSSAGKLLSPLERLDITKTYNEQYRFIENEFLNGEPLFSESIPDPQEHWQHPCHDRNELIESFLHENEHVTEG